MLETIMNMSDFDKLPDTVLIAETRRVAAAERTATADLIALLMEVERRSLHLSLGYSSMFAFCTQSLKLSEQAAYSRITAARAARRFPAILDRLSTGALRLSSVGLPAPHLTLENLDSVMAAAEGKSTREIERLIASMHPQPDIPSSVRAVPVTQPPLAETPSSPAQRPAAVSLLVSGRTVVAPLAPGRFFLRVTISTETNDKLQRLRALMRHTIPDGDPAKIVDRALTVLLDDVERAKLAKTLRPRTPGAVAGPSATRHIPAGVRRDVWQRDGGRCAFHGGEGRCAETAFLEFHHVTPFAAGGPTIAGNLELRCRAHNAHEARLYFGGAEQAGTSPPLQEARWP